MFLLLDGSFAGRRLHGGQPGVRAGERRVDLCIQRTLAADVPFVAQIVAHGIGQIVLQNLTQPSRKLGVAAAAILILLGERI